MSNMYQTISGSGCLKPSETFFADFPLKPIHKSRMVIFWFPVKPDETREILIDSYIIIYLSIS